MKKIRKKKGTATKSQPPRESTSQPQATPPGRGGRNRRERLCNAKSPATHPDSSPMTAALTGRQAARGRTGTRVARQISEGMTIQEAVSHRTTPTAPTGMPRVSKPQAQASSSSNPDISPNHGADSTQRAVMEGRDQTDAMQAVAILPHHRPRK